MTINLAHYFIIQNSFHTKLISCCNKKRKNPLEFYIWGENKTKQIKQKDCGEWWMMGKVSILSSLFDGLCCKQCERTFPRDQPKPEHTNEQGDYRQGIQKTATNVNAHLSSCAE